MNSWAWRYVYRALIVPVHRQLFIAHPHHLQTRSFRFIGQGIFSHLDLSLAESQRYYLEMKSILLASLAAWGAYAQSGAWGQCGGINWSGPTSCISGYTCVYQNDWYSQCLPASQVPTTTTKAPSTTLTTSTRPPTSTSNPGNGSKKMKWVGVNLSVAEFGQGTYPGTWGKEFYFPDNNAVSVR